MRGFEDLVIHAVDDGGIDVIATRRRDDDFLGAAMHMRRGLGLAGEQPGAFQHHVGADAAPGDLGRVAFREHPDLVAVYPQVIALDAHRAGKLAVSGVVAGEVRVGGGIAQVVDSHDLDVMVALAFVECAQDVAPDAAVTVDSDFDWHASLLG